MGRPVETKGDEVPLKSTAEQTSRTNEPGRRDRTTTHRRSGGVVVLIAAAAIRPAACGGCSSSSLARLRSVGAPGGRHSPGRLRSSRGLMFRKVCRCSHAASSRRVTPSARLLGRDRATIPARRRPRMELQTAPVRPRKLARSPSIPRHRPQRYRRPRRPLNGLARARAARPFRHPDRARESRSALSRFLSKSPKRFGRTSGYLGGERLTTSIRRASTRLREALGERSAQRA